MSGGKGEPPSAGFHSPAARRQSHRGGELQVCLWNVPASAGQMELREGPGEWDHATFTCDIPIKLSEDDDRGYN